MGLWGQLGGGFARSRVYSHQLTGVDYCLKGLEQNFDEAKANSYEVGKYSGSGEGFKAMIADGLVMKWQAGQFRDGSPWAHSRSKAARCEDTRVRALPTRITATPSIWERKRG